MPWGKRKKTQNGLSGTREYRTWANMIRRCSDKRHKTFSNYGGRGITVSKRWKNSFLKFLEDMGNKPDGHDLDRKNPNSGYSKRNCVWTPSSKNRGTNRRNVLDEKTVILIRKSKEKSAKLARILGVSPNTVLCVKKNRTWKHINQKEIA